MTAAETTLIRIHTRMYFADRPVPPFLHCVRSSAAHRGRLAQPYKIRLDGFAKAGGASMSKTNSPWFCKAHFGRCRVRRKRRICLLTVNVLYYFYGGIWGMPPCRFFPAVRAGFPRPETNDQPPEKP